MERRDGDLPCCRCLEDLWLRRDTQGHGGPEGTWAKGSHCEFRYVQVQQADGFQRVGIDMDDSLVIS